MGSGPGAVVGELLRVQGIAGLHLADHSVMAAIISGNADAPSILIGEEASEMVRQHPRVGA